MILDTHIKDSYGNAHLSSQAGGQKWAHTVGSLASQASQSSKH